MGSDWTQTEITHTIKHKGKVKVYKTHIPMFDKKDKEKEKKK